MRQERRQDLRRLDDLAHAQHEQHDEPDERDRPEPAADAGRAEMLHGEQRHQHAERDRHDQRLRAGVATLRPSTALSTEMAGVSRQSP